MVAINPGHPVAFLKTYPSSSLIIGPVSESPVQAMLRSETDKRYVVAQGMHIENLIGGFVRLGPKIDEEKTLYFRAITPRTPTSNIDVLCYHGMKIMVNWSQTSSSFEWRVLMNKGDYGHSFTSDSFGNGYDQLERKISGDYLDITRNAVRHLVKNDSKRKPAELREWLVNNYRKACKKFQAKF